VARGCGRTAYPVLMLSAYRPLLRVPGALAFIAGGALARIGGAMFGVSIIVMVSSRRGSFSLAGAITAVAVLVLAAAGPILGRLVDRFGQRRIVLPFAVWSTLCGFATVVLSWTGAPAWTLFLAYGLSAILPEMGPLSRARWAHVFAAEPDTLHTAMSFEQVMDEGSFVLGPVLGIVLSTVWFPEAGLLIAYVLYFIGMVAFVSARATEPPVVAHHDRPGGYAVARPGMFVVAAVLTMVGVIFGANEVVAVAVSKEAGQESFSSVILALFAVGSTIAGIAFGARVFRISLTHRLRYAALGMFLLEAPALFVTDLRGIALVMLVAGCATAPMLITAMSLSQRLVPQALVTEGMAVAITGILIGISTGAAAGGWAVEHVGPHEAYAVPVTAGFVAVVLSSAFFGRILRAEQAASNSEPALLAP
jgi:MFS family permease